MVAADELLASVDDDLRGVGAIEAEAVDEGGLAIGELAGGEGILPAEVVPISDVFADADDGLAGGGLLAGHLGEELVGGRAVGAALGGEEFYEDYAGTGLRGGGQAGEDQDCGDHALHLHSTNLG